MIHLHLGREILSSTLPSLIHRHFRWAKPSCLPPSNTALRIAYPLSKSDLLNRETIKSTRPARIIEPDWSIPSVLVSSRSASKDWGEWTLLRLRVLPTSVDSALSLLIKVLDWLRLNQPPITDWELHWIVSHLSEPILVNNPLPKSLRDLSSVLKWYLPGRSPPALT